jgi:hypothetical protein
MALALVLSEFSYTSGSAADQFLFTVVSDSLGNLSVRDIQNAYGKVVSPYTRIPQSVEDDIHSAISQVEAIMAATSAVNGTLTFTDSHEETFTFTEAMTSAGYRVQVSSDAFVPLRISAQSTTTFTVQAGADFTGTIGFDVFV